jgi:hypothetical protein
MTFRRSKIAFLQRLQILLFGQFQLRLGRFRFRCHEARIDREQQQQCACQAQKLAAYARGLKR